ncbi:MAG TPA: DUF4097 family beta strand repeat-containing protein [Terriglobales bacterium]|nr:DUF4097 family beta strand repeat-containing protein [Terriglobales bacterium]
MTNGTQTQTPRPRSYFGPIILIGLGVAFLLINAGFWSWGNVGWWFARYWPLFIILWGVVKLVEYYQARSEGRPAPGIGGGGIVLLVFVILFGMMASQASRVNWGSLGDEMDLGDDFPILFGTRYTYNQQLDQAFPAGGSLRVSLDRGDIKLRAGTDDKLHVTVRKTVLAGSQSEADRTNSSMQPVINVSGSEVAISIANYSRGSAMDLEIQVPRKAVADLMTLRGNVEVEGREGNVKAHTSRGDVSMDDVTGNAEIHLRRGSIRARKVTGDVDVEGWIHDSNLSEIGGAVNLHGDFFGTMSLAKVGKGVRFKSSRTDLEMGRLDGDMTMEIGDLRARGVTGPFRIVTRSKDIHLEDMNGDIKVDSNHADVELTSDKPPTGAVEIVNDHGHISVELPAKANFQMTARTDHGDIQSDFGELKVENSDRESKATGAVGAGGPALRLTNSHGDINIRKTG